jgi:hypothetical protein
VRGLLELCDVIRLNQVYGIPNWKLPDFMHGKKEHLMFFEFIFQFETKS